LIAGALTEKRHYREALKHYQIAVGLEPEDSLCRYNMAICLLRQKRYSDAIVQFREVLKRSKNSALTYYNLGICQEKVGEREAARESYLASAKCDPTFVLAQRKLSAFAK
jgi:Tfp pilus assembly protein PilF